MSVIATIEQLEAIYGFPNDASTVKVADRVTPPYRILIEKSPFAELATSGPEGLDCSPRGDLPGFVRIHDEKTLMMPDRRGNNRVDSLRNIVRDPRRVAVPDSGLRRHAAHQRPRACVGRPGFVCLVQDGRQGAAHGRRHDGGRDLFPMRPRHRALRSLESGQAGRSQNLADARPDSRRHERQHRRRREIRSRMAGACAADDVVTMPQDPAAAATSPGSGPCVPAG